MFEITRVKLASLLSKLYRLVLRKDDSPETIIHDICNDIEGKMVQLSSASKQLEGRIYENNQLIDELEVENDAIEHQHKRADNLQRGLDKLLRGE